MGKETVQRKNKVENTEKITFSWCDVFNNTKEIPEGYQTVEEISRETGLGTRSICEKMKNLLKAGKVNMLKRNNIRYYKLI